MPKLELIGSQNPIDICKYYDNKINDIEQMYSKSTNNVRVLYINIYIYII